MNAPSPSNNGISVADIQQIVRDEVSEIIQKALALSDDENKEWRRKMARILERFETLLAGSKEFDTIGLIEKHRQNSAEIKELREDLAKHKNEQQIQETELKTWIRSTIFWAVFFNAVVTLAVLIAGFIWTVSHHGP